MLFLLHQPVPDGPFTAAWSLHPSVLIGAAVLAALYFYGLGPWRRRHRLGPPASPWRVASFCLSLLVLLGVLNGPLHDLSDGYLFSAHMLQHLLLQLVWPPLLLAGLPGWLLTPFFRRPRVRLVARVLTHPVAAGLLFALVLVAWHVPALYGVMMTNHDMHIVSHLMFMGTAVLMWWPVMSRSPEVPPLPYGLRMLYLFLVGIPMQAVAAPITLADTVLYHFYAEAPRTWGLTALQDQQWGGLLMWVPGGLYMGAAIAVVFFQWARREAETDRLEAEARRAATQPGIASVR